MIENQYLHDNHVDPNAPLAADRYEQLVVVAGVAVEGVQFAVVEVPVPHMRDNHVGAVVVVAVDMSAFFNMFNTK